jgi:molybdopterin converting factor subunit 1
VITVRYFAAARERAGVATEQLELPAGAPLRQLVDELVRRHPTLAPLLPHLRFAVDQELVGPDATVGANAEVALIPPVAGGSGSPAFAILGLPLSLEHVVEAVSEKGQGGVVTFTGAVRDHNRGKQVTRLEYEAYDEMALKVLRSIGEEAAQQWPGARLAIHHRVGVLEPGELAVVIAASAAHRAEAFDACRYAIEQLKARAPIWKKEFYPDGDAWVGLGP